MVSGIIAGLTSQPVKARANIFPLGPLGSVAFSKRVTLGPNGELSLAYGAVSSLFALRFGTDNCGWIRSSSSIWTWGQSSNKVLTLDTNNINIGSLSKYGWCSGADSNGTVDTLLKRSAAASIQMGVDAAGVVTPQTFGACNRITSDGVGADLIIGGGKNLGASSGGALRLQTSVAAATTVAGSRIDRGFIFGGEKTLTEATATIVVNVALAAAKYCGGSMTATVHADDGTDYQCQTDHFAFAAVNKAGTVTAVIQGTPSTSGAAASAGTLTPITWTIVANGNGFDIKCAATSSLTQTTLSVSWQIRLNSNDGALAVTP